MSGAAIVGEIIKRLLQGQSWDSIESELNTWSDSPTKGDRT